MKLSVIIVNFNVKYFLEQCLISVQKACEGLSAEIFVVDNNSTDGSREYLDPKFPGVIFKWNSNNPGFGAANNSVLKEANGDYILFLNPDTIVPEDAFSKCIHFFETHKVCGGLGVKMLDGSGRFLKESKRGLPSAKSSLYKMAGLSSIFSSSKLFAGYYAGHLPENKTNEVEVLAGAFMMLSRKAALATDGFDERYFMYAEDIDLSYRIIQAGMKNYYFPEVSIIHFKGESTQRSSPYYVKHFYGAMELFVQKHYPQKKAVLVMMNTAIGAGKIMALLKQRFKQEKVKRKKYQVAVVASQEQFTRSIQVLKHASPPVTIAGRISIQSPDNGEAIGDINHLEACLKDHKINLLAFCEGDISYKRIIELTGSFTGKTSFLFSGNESNVFIGSDDKNARGWFINYS